jgi:cell division inhibitor SepF
VQRNTRAWLGLVEHDNDALVNKDGYASEDVSDIQNDDGTPSGQLAMGNGIQIAIVRPRNFRDAATVGEYYRQEIPVIINLEDMDNTEAVRIIDFVSGLILGLCGDIERLSRRAFLIVPADATILTTHDGLTEEGFFNQALQPVNDSPVSPAGRTTISRTKGHCHAARTREGGNLASRPRRRSGCRRRPGSSGSSSPAPARCALAGHRCASMRWSISLTMEPGGTRADYLYGVHGLHLSMPPTTGSMLAIAAIMSAIMEPSHITGIAWR